MNISKVGQMWGKFPKFEVTLIWVESTRTTWKARRKRRVNWPNQADTFEDLKSNSDDAVFPSLTLSDLVVYDRVFPLKTSRKS